jgi:hypothetical protein
MDVEPIGIREAVLVPVADAKEHVEALRHDGNGSVSRTQRRAMSTIGASHRRPLRSPVAAAASRHGVKAGPGS